METEADGRDDAEHGGPGADPAPKRRRTHTHKHTHTAVIFSSSQVTCTRWKKKKSAIIRASFIMPWHLETLWRNVHPSVTGTRPTRGKASEADGVYAVTQGSRREREQNRMIYFVCPGFTADIWIRLRAAIFPGAT